jgi:hypothetical protein
MSRSVRKSDKKVAENVHCLFPMSSAMAGMAVTVIRSE